MADMKTLSNYCSSQRSSVIGQQLLVKITFFASELDYTSKRKFWEVVLILEEFKGE